MSQNHYPSRIAWLIWSISLVFTLLQFLLQLSSGVIVDQLMRDFSLNAFGAGLLSSVYYYIYVILQTPAGMLMDRYKPRFLITCGAVLCGVSTILFSRTHNLWTAALFRLLMGTGGAVAFVGSVHLMREWFHPKRFAVLMGLTEAIGMLFSVAGTVGLAALMGHFGWRDGMSFIGCGMVVTAVFCGIFVRENNYKPASPHAESVTSFMECLRLVVSDKALFWNGLYCGILFSVLSVFSALWGIPFLQELAGYSLTQATLATSLVFVGAGIGTPLIGALYTRIQSYRILMVGGALIETVILMLIIWLPYYNDIQIYSLLFLAGLGSSPYVLNFTLANDLSHPATKSTATGYTNSLCVITAPIFQPIIGYLMANVEGSRTITTTLTGYAVIDYQFSLTLLPFFTFVAAIIAAFLPEPRERKQSHA